MTSTERVVLVLIVLLALTGALSFWRAKSALERCVAAKCWDIR